MTASLAKLLEGVFDYASLFPPAEQSMSDAVKSYLTHRSNNARHMLDRFICPSNQLEEFLEAAASHNSGEAIPVSVVSSPNKDWGDRLVADAQAMTRFVEKSGNLADIEAYEVRIPDLAGIDEYARDLRSFNQIDVFCELPWEAGLEDALGVLAEQEWLGAKARTGGITADAFPSTTQVAQFLRQCVHLELPFKLTAGLHHPIRSHRDEVQTKMHGFLNVLVASTMLVAHELSSSEVAMILESENPTDFTFDEGGLRFGTWTAEISDIEDARDLFVGIGSCSVEEPMQDLEALSL